MFNWTGQKLGNYQIMRLLGQGGFADVYLGQHVYLSTYAAIKVLQMRLTPHDLQAFLQEAQTLAGLAHSHIIRVLEFGEENHTPYLIMDYCPNGTLRHRHPKNTRVSFPVCVAYIEQIAEALQYAHDRRIIHRDVKPENMLISADGAVLLSDFGIAANSQSSRYQQSQDIGGTIAYSAPEQLQGKASRASDQYALGIVLYEWLVGKLPYQGSFSEIASQHLVAPVPVLREQVPSVPLAVEQVLQTALAKDPRQRFASVHDFAAALKASAEGTASPLTFQTFQRNPWNQSAGQTTDSTYLRTQATPTKLSGTVKVPTLKQSPSEVSLPRIPAAYQATRLPRRRKMNISAVVITLLILALVGVSARLFLFISSNANPSDPARPQAVATIGAKDRAAQQAPGPTTVPTPTPSPTPIVIQNPERRLSCTTQFGGSCTSSIIVHSFAIDSQKNQLLMNFTLKNNGSYDYIYYLSISFQDQANAQYTADGQASDKSTWSTVSGQSLTLVSIFPFVPQKGGVYTLHISASPTNGTMLDLYTNQITF